MKNVVEQLPSLRHKVDKIRSRVVSEKFNGSTHVSAKGSINKCGNHTSTYATGTKHNNKKGKGENQSNGALWEDQ